MSCQWQMLINILPLWMRNRVDTVGKDTLQEIRLRLNSYPQLIMKNEVEWLNRKTTPDDISYCINASTKYSPWTSGSICDGFIAAMGGHRIGISGEFVYENGKIRNIPRVSSLCIRVARDIPDVSGNIYRHAGSVLIIGSPGTGKTTFLRDLIRKISNHFNGSVAVIDERRELFPWTHDASTFPTGRNTDILSGCRKTEGIEMAIRTMSPRVIAVDEITNADDCHALSMAAWCGVRLLATAHAGSKSDLYSREIYRPILDSKIFDTLIILHADKSWCEDVVAL